MKLLTAIFTVHIIVGHKSNKDVFMPIIKSIHLFLFYCICSMVFILPAHAAPIIEWQPEQLSIRQPSGSAVNNTVGVMFSQGTDSLNTRLTEGLNTWLSVRPAISNDVQAGESLQLTLSGIVPADEARGIHRGVLQIRSGAAQNNLAKPLPNAITIAEGLGDKLPPDPGKEGKQTLMGIDSDDDGLRDDIQRYIYLTYPDQPNVKNALRQLSLTFQKTLDPEREVGTGRSIANEMSLGIDCLSYFADEGFYEIGMRHKAEVLNTYDRTRQYLAYDKELSGGIFSGSDLPYAERYKHCEFEIQP